MGQIHYVLNVLGLGIYYKGKCVFCDEIKTIKGTLKTTVHSALRCDDCLTPSFRIFSDTVSCRYCGASFTWGPGWGDEDPWEWRCDNCETVTTKDTYTYCNVCDKGVTEIEAEFAICPDCECGIALETIEGPFECSSCINE